MAAMQYTVKTIKKSSPESEFLWFIKEISSRTRSTFILKLGMLHLQILYKWCPWVNHDLFYGKVKRGRQSS